MTFLLATAYAKAITETSASVARHLDIASLAASAMVLKYPGSEHISRCSVRNGEAENEWRSAAEESLIYSDKSSSSGRANGGKS